MTPVLNVDSLSLSLGGKEILKDVSFQVPEGIHLCVVGPNGAGKTSLLKCLMRIHTRWTGSIRIAGFPVSSMTQKELARKVGYVPQAGERSFPFTSSRFLLMSRYPNLSPFSPPSQKDRQVVREAFALTGTTEFAERDMRTLSGGERQKVFLAAVLAQGARILLLDEPATFLDPFHEEKVLAILENLRRRSGKTIISVTHDINHAVLFADRVLALAGGEVV
ncbi:MAG: ABC transporter ATP-binding protein, partial [Proteobacteria bacterium]|nr:ABC transporter ATP-binding protein [Pseudomonadota bacterium]